MKKLLILMLILGMASAANAAIELDGPAIMNVGDTVSIGIYNTDGVDYLAYMSVFYISEGGFAMSNPQLTALAGDLSSFSAPYEYSDIKEIEVTLKGTSIPGIQFTWDLQYLDGCVTVWVELWDNSDLSAPVDSLEINTPEPMTLALLGLGGLFVLRRRK